MKRNVSASRPAPTQRPTPVPSRKAQHQSPVWLNHHLYTLFFSLGQLARAPLPTLLTAAVIGISLALPAGLYLLLENVKLISSTWGGTTQISLFLDIQVDDEQAQILGKELATRTDIHSVHLINRDEALAEYRNLSGFAEALDVLEENPLPPVLVIQPDFDMEQADRLQALLNDLKQLPTVAVAQFDMRWLERLFALVAVAQRGMLILAALLALTVLLVVGNTIRLAIHNRRDEIEINKLFGATDSFIRRPFLYSGLWYGLGGGLIAWLLISLSFWLLADPIRHLSALYYSQFALRTLNMEEMLILLITAVLLGLFGAWLAVGRHLRAIRPR